MTTLRPIVPFALSMFVALLCFSIRLPAQELLALPAVSESSDFRLLSYSELEREYQQNTEEKTGSVGSEVALALKESVSLDASCCDPVWAHRNGFFSELLLLRPRGGEVAYAVPIDGPIASTNLNGVQIGPTAIVDPDYHAGFRVGMNFALDDCTSVAAKFSHFESSANSSTAIGAPDVIRSLVTHTLTTNTATDGSSASATSGIDFDIFDVDYRRLWDGGDQYAVNYLVGLRYARMDQDFRGNFVGTGTTMVNSAVIFEGTGIRLGLDAERFAFHGGWLFYAKGDANFLAGDISARYRQSQTFSSTVVDTSWKAGRVVSILDLEIGFGWESCSGNWRWTTGYLMSSWFNTITTNRYIQAVQQNNFVGMDDSITFDGLTSRLEYRW